MKITIGIILGILITIASIHLLPFINQYLPTLPLPTLQIDHKYVHEAEGENIQTLEMIENENYRSAEGNIANLYKLRNQCKLTLSIFGESSQYHISFYFHKNKVLRAFQTELTYPNGGFYAEEKTERAFELQESLFSILNPENSKTYIEFKTLAEFFDPKFIQEC